jgi:hypothetical protein
VVILVKVNTGRSMMLSLRGGGRICEACVTLARGRVKVTGLYCAKPC